MNIYIVYRTDDIGYDEYYEKVIAAETENAACELAEFFPHPIKCRCIGYMDSQTACEEEAPCVLSACFNAG